VRTRVNRLGKGIGLLVREGLKTQLERRIVMPRLVVDVLRKRWPRQLESRLIAGTQWEGPDYADGQPTGFIFTGAAELTEIHSVLSSELGDPCGIRTRDLYLERVASWAARRTGLETSTRAAALGKKRASGVYAINFTDHEADAAGRV
jgi:hypothetical protein